MQLCVLIFNPGSQNEGIYTLNMSNQNTVVAFENEEDATRYAMLLEAQDFMVPQVECVDVEEIRRFCEEAGLELLVVEQGKLLIPPPTNKEQLDWQPETAPASDLDSLRTQLENLFRNPS